MDATLAASIGSFMSLTQVGSGNNAVLKVDLDGLEDFASPEMVIQLTGAWSAGNLADDQALQKLINDRVILV